MAATHGNEPTAYQEAFVVEMQARRDAAGLSRNKLAQALGCTPQWIAKVETYEKAPSEGLADDLDTFFQCGRTFRHMWEKHIEVRKLGLMPSGFRPLADAEVQASCISIFAPLVIPGLFQTEEHARMILRTEHLPGKADELVALRMERQSVFTKANPPWLFLLLREAVLRDLRPEIREAQCQRLLKAIAEPNISIQLIPARAGVTQSSGFQLLSFSGGADIAYVDGACGHGQMLTDQPDVERVAVSFNVIRSTALPAEETENLIRMIMEAW